jgi:hypothetical protein
MRRLIVIIFLFQGVSAFGQTKSGDTICSSGVDTLTGKEIYWVADKMPTVQGGLQTLSREISKRIKYQQVDKYPIETKVIVAFIVTEGGQLIGKRVVKNIVGTNLGDQLLGILDDFKWEPGECKGKAVSTLFVFPMIVELRR